MISPEVVASQKGGLSKGWPLKRVASQKGGLSKGWPLKRVASQKGGLSKGWPLKRSPSVMLIVHKELLMLTL